MTLPNGWAWTTLGEIRFGERRSVAPAKTPDQMFELYSVPSFETGRPEIVSGKDVGSSKQVVNEFSVLVCKINPRINRVWVVGDYSQHPKIASTEWIAFEKLEGINPHYLCYFMRTSTFHDFLAMNVSGVGGSLMRARASALEDYPFPLAPLSEQHRIVAEIEKQFTRLDAGVAALKRVQANLKRYKASVLKAACEGRLVAQGPNDEPASELLARILEQRRKSAVTAPQRKHVEPAPPDTDGLPELPRGWCWATLAQLSWDASYGTSQKCDYNASGPPVIRIPNITNGGFDLNDLKYATKADELDEANALVPNDLLIIRTNGSKDLIGRTGLVRQPFEQPHFYASYLIRFRTVDVPHVAVWLSTIWDASGNRRQIEQIAATSAGQYNVSVGSLSKLRFPLPPSAEQRRIVAEVERRLSVVQEVEAVIAANLARAERLRQSILKQAFEGKLVPQDPNDEPASVLLERIRAQRAAATPVEAAPVVKRARRTARAKRSP